jgi:hypothetical protein
LVLDIPARVAPMHHGDSLPQVHRRRFCAEGIPEAGGCLSSGPGAPGRPISCQWVLGMSKAAVF